MYYTHIIEVRHRAKKMGNMYWSSLSFIRCTADDVIKKSEMFANYGDVQVFTHDEGTAELWYNLTTHY